MLYYIEFYVCNLIFDFSTTIIYKNIFALKCKNIYLLMLQIFSIVISTLYLFCKLSILILILLKILMALLICLLTEERYSFKNITTKFLLFTCLIFVVFGLYCFLTLFYIEILNGIFYQKNAKSFKFVVIIAIFMQYLVIFCINSSLNKKKNFKKFLAKVEFNILSEHIKCIGLIDSGNMLYDEKTKLPVVIVSLQILKKYISKINYELITISMNNTRKVECIGVDGKKFKIPIFDICDGEVECGGERKSVKFTLGVLEEKIYDINEYECLLHRDFI